MFFNDLLLSNPLFSCYDGESDTQGEEAPPDLSGEGKINFTPEQQEFVNKLLAEDRRKHKAKFEQLQSTVEKLRGDGEAKQELERQLEQMRDELMTKEEKANRDKKKLEEEARKTISELTKRVEAAESKYSESTIQRALLDAAQEGDAFNPRQIVALLRAQTRLEITDDGHEKVVVYMEGTDPNTDEKKMLPYTPAQAIEKMRDEPEAYGNLFKSNVVGGVGGNPLTGNPTDKNGRIDVRKLSPAQYQKLRKENPQLLGFDR